jgi:hypothetical protein
MHRIPINGMPGPGRCGECTSGLARCHLPSLPKRLIKLSCDERPDGRLLAFAWSDVAWWLNSYPPHYRIAFAFSILSGPHIHGLTLRFAFPFGPE